MGKMSAEELVDALKAALGEDLVSVVLYGSGAAGDATGALSDTNLLVVTRDLTAKGLFAAAGPVARWTKGGEPPPVFLTTEEVASSADVFALEYADLADARKVLFGPDLFAGFAPTREALRSELEREFRGKMLRLRAAYLAAAGDRKRTEDLLLRSVSTFQVLFRGALRLDGEKPPLKKAEALARLRARFPFDDEVFRLLDHARSTGRLEGDPEALFARYLAALEDVIRRVNDHAKKA